MRFFKEKISFEKKDMLNELEVLLHSSIRIAAERTVYVDPFRIDISYRNADVIFITHAHYDHFSPEDIVKVAKEDTVIVVPEAMTEDAKAICQADMSVIGVRPAQSLSVCGIPVETVASYNINKDFHPKQNEWVGYIITLNGIRYFITGDTDSNPDNRKVLCDVALVPVGGTYTMDAKEAAEFVNLIKPKFAVPTHYGSVVGKPGDGDTFAKFVDPSIQTVLKIGK